MREKILQALSFAKYLIVSPDIDGFISAKLLQMWNPEIVVVGTYDKNVLTLAEGVDPKDCLFVDCDMNQNGFVSIGNHMRLGSSDNVDVNSFNPNTFLNISKYSDKYPFATAFLISAVIEVPIPSLTNLYMAYADSTYKNLEKYSENMLNWQKRMHIHGLQDNALDRVFELSEEDLEILKNIEDVYPKQGFVSKKFGKSRYLETMNNALENFGLTHKKIVTGQKFLSDKVGRATVKKYSSDILSYAEIFTGEYSITYNQEIEWR